MSRPIVFISHFRIKAGMAAQYMEFQPHVAKSLGAGKPRTLAGSSGVPLALHPAFIGGFLRPAAAADA